MTMQEICKKYGVSESSVRTAFPRTQKAIWKKYGVWIEREGVGKKAVYLESATNNHPANLYEETKDEIIINNSSVKTMNLEFCCLLAIAISPMLTFRGSFADFCRYVELDFTIQNTMKIKWALSALEEKGYINYMLDRTDMTYFVASIYKKAEDELKLGAEIIDVCKRIAEKERKRDWVPILKTWIGVHMVAEEEEITASRIQELSGLSRYQVLEIKELLKREPFFDTERAVSALRRCKE